MPTWPSPSSEQLGTPNPPAIRFTRGTSFGASRFTHLLRPAKLLAPLYGSDRYARPSGAFTSRLPTDRLPSPLLDMTTTATGLLCWRDFHPLEWQLASLHQIVPWSTLCRADWVRNGSVRGAVFNLAHRQGDFVEMLLNGFEHVLVLPRLNAPLVCRPPVKYQPVRKSPSRRSTGSTAETVSSQARGTSGWG